MADNSGAIWQTQFPMNGYPHFHYLPARQSAPQFVEEVHEENDMAAGRS